jgi:hypothetical protein
MEAIVRIFDAINYLLTTVFVPLAVLVTLFALSYVFFVKWLPGWISKNGFFRGLYIGFITLIPIIIWIGFFWFGISYITSHVWLDTETPRLILRLVLIGGTVFLFIFLMSDESGKARGIVSLFFHLITFVVGWAFGKWLGVFFISLPILAVYYNSIYRFADGIIPVSNSEDKKENQQRFRVFLWYTWGFQHSIQVARDNNSPTRDSETRIKGASSSGFSAPGLIWLKSHQAVALTTGTNFSRIEGPRVVFTKPNERLLEVVDLRTQKRIATIDVVSKDGVRFKAKVAASFALDREKWSHELYNKLYQKNPTLTHAMRPNTNEDGIYPFSRSRIQAALRMRGKTDGTSDKQILIYWDERVFNQVEVIASHILAQRKFDELWLPINDGPGVSALDEIADQIKERLEIDLLSQGVRLFSARVIDFDFSEYTKRKEAESHDPNHKELDVVIKQQIESWRVDWESHRSQIIADANAEANRRQQAARAHVQSVLLTAIAEGLEQIRIRYPNLPHHVIAMHFVGALERLAQQEPDQDSNGDENPPNPLKVRGRSLTDRKDH